MLDQVCLGSSPSSASSGISGSAPLAFPAPFARIERPPVEELNTLWRTFPEDLALEILHDWGLLLRISLEGLVETEEYPRELLASRYAKAALRWLIQRIAFEELLLLAPPPPSQEQSTKLEKSVSSTEEEEEA